LNFEVVAPLVNKILRRWDVTENTIHEEVFCLCCMNAFGEANISVLASQVHAASQVKQCTEVALDTSFPPILDAFRVASRAIICMDINKSIAFPTFEDLLKNILSTVLKHKYGLHVSNAAKWMVNLFIAYMYCGAYQHYGKNRCLWG
jgi:hypothetical protein